jgi:hypothetical protein
MYIIVNNSRFLVLPWLAVKNLASTILSRAARQLVDWAGAYGVTPMLLETLVDPRFDGASYRAANWIAVGTTTGRERNDRHRRLVRVPKRVLIYPLVPAPARDRRAKGRDRRDPIIYEAKLAELELLHQGRMRSSVDPAERTAMEEGYRRDRERLMSERDSKIEKARRT